MSNHALLSLNDTKDEERWLPCSECDGQTCHKILLSANTKESENDISFYNEYEIIQCQGCRTISFCKNWQWSEDFDEDGLIDHLELYPGRVAGRHKLRDSQDNLPQQINSIYNETQVWE